MKTTTIKKLKKLLMLLALFAGVHQIAAQTSLDLDAWTNRFSGISNQVYGLTYANGIFVAATDVKGILRSSGDLDITSPDGVNWTLHSTSVYGQRAVALGNGQFVEVGVGGEINTSPDAINWTGQDSGTSQDLEGVAYGDGKFVAVGMAGTILTSPNGANWTAHPLGDTTVTLYCVIYIPSRGLFVAVGTGLGIDDPGYLAEILTSPDGVNWTYAGTFSGPSHSNFLGTLYSVCFNAGKFVAVGSSGLVFDSTDGSSWINVVSGTTADLHAIAVAPSLFVAVGTGGTILSSPDGTTWTSRNSGTTTNLFAIAFNGLTFVAGGTNELLLQSGRFLLPPLYTKLPGGGGGGGGDLFSLTWSSAAVGFIPQQSTQLSGGTNWFNYTGAISDDGTNMSISVPIGVGNGFFRLKYNRLVSGTALSFDGTASYVSVGTAPLSPPWTAEFWVNRQDAPNYSASLLGDGSTALKLEQFNFTRLVGFTQFGVADYTFNYSAPTNTWVHLAFVCDTTTRLYVNGVLQDSNPNTINLPLGRIGYDSSGVPDYLRGTLDEVRVWNVARTQAQIQANMNHTLSVPQANLVGYWKFEEGTGTTASDSSGQGKTGTLQNSPAWVNSTAPLVP